MSLITIGRSLVSQDQDHEDAFGKEDELGVTSESCSKSSHSEDFFMCKTSAVTLNVKSQRRTSVVKTTDNLHEHLKKILSILRFEDYIKLIVKLENPAPRPFWHRYLAIISTVGTLGSEESIILGLDVQKGEVTVGLVLPILQDMAIKLDGDGGFKLITKTTVYLFKPISVQALWAAHQAIMIACRVAQTRAYHARGLSHTWITYYSSLAFSDPQKLYEWNKMEDIEDMGRATPQPVELSSTVDDNEKRTQLLQANIRTRLQILMSSVDLEDVTVLQLREMLEKEMGISLKEQRQFIADQVLLIYGQMDAASVIFDHLLLGSSFNASNGVELQQNNVTHIINVTREVDNFFPSSRFTYKNVRVFDDEKADLLTHWEDTHRFINEARANGTRCLVHCKMGISRSGATVVAYVMKEKGWDLKKSLDYVRSKRPCVNPNPNFLRQLETYQGILEASSNRHKPIFQNCTPATTPEMGLKVTANPALRHSARFEAAACLPGPAAVSSESPDLLQEYNTDLGPNPPNSVDLEAELFVYKTVPNQPPVKLADAAKDRTAAAANTVEPPAGRTNNDPVQSTQTSGPIPILVEPVASKHTVLATTSQCLRHWHHDLYEDLAPPPDVFLSPNASPHISRSRSSPTYTSAFKRVVTSQPDGFPLGHQQPSTGLPTVASASTLSVSRLWPPGSQRSLDVLSGARGSYRSSCDSLAPMDISIPLPQREQATADSAAAGSGLHASPCRDPSPASSHGSSISEHDFVVTLGPHPPVDANIATSEPLPIPRHSRSNSGRRAELGKEEQTPPNCAFLSSPPRQPVRFSVDLDAAPGNSKPLSVGSVSGEFDPEYLGQTNCHSCKSVPETSTAMEPPSSSLAQPAGGQAASSACNRSTSLMLRVRPDDSWIQKAPAASANEHRRATVPIILPAPAARSISDLPSRLREAEEEGSVPSRELLRPTRRIVSSMEPIFLRRQSAAGVAHQPQSVPLLADS